MNKDEILNGILRTLIRGWGEATVRAAIEHVSHDPTGTPDRARAKKVRRESEQPDALKFVEGMLPLANQELLLRFAQEYDREQALPKLADIRRFLAAHHVRRVDIKTRNQAFRYVFPLLRGMSEKGLLRVIDRSRSSGPAQLDEISDAIKYSGSDMRRMPSN
jgi:hypothetical protein